MRAPNREALAWAAGFFDGEGYIGPTRSKGWVGLTIHVVQASREPFEMDGEPPIALLRFRDAVGVPGILEHRGPSRPGGLPRWSLRINRFQDVQQVVASLWPWLGAVKRAQAASAINVQAAAWRGPKTHCKRGHAFDEANTSYKQNRSGGVSRRCRACARLRTAKSRAKAVA